MDKVVSHLCRTNKKESFERQMNLYGIKKDLSTGNYVHQNLFKGASQAQLALLRRPRMPPKRSRLHKKWALQRDHTDGSTGTSDNGEDEGEGKEERSHGRTLSFWRPNSQLTATPCRSQWLSHGEQ